MPSLRSCDWIDVPGGGFWMGGGPRDNENPRHRVFISALRLASTQVTRADYQRFLDQSSRQPPPFWDEPRFSDPRMPAVGPSWHDASAYCEWIAGETGEPVRLPTEAEWERAAKAGREVLYPWGDEPPEAVVDYAQRWLGAPEPVDAYPSTHPWGFLGLGENVHEWCADWYDADYYRVSPERDPRGPGSGQRRSARGGSWRHRVRVSRCAARSAIRPEFQYDDFGFRLACDVPSLRRDPPGDRVLDTPSSGSEARAGARLVRQGAHWERGRPARMPSGGGEQARRLRSQWGESTEAG